VSVRTAVAGVLAMAALLVGAVGARAATPIGPLTSAQGCAALSPGGTREAGTTTSTTTTSSASTTTSTPATSTTTTSTTAAATTAQAGSSTTTTSTGATTTTSAAASSGAGPGPIKGCGGASGLSSPNGVAISPDGTSIYVIGGIGGTSPYGVLDILHRDPTTGDLTEVACLSSDGTDGQTGASQACLPTPGLLGGGAVAVSPDGTTVYTGSSASAAILAFHRDPTTGLLTRFGCLRLTPPLNSGCTVANVFGGIDALALSPDGQGLYAGSGVGGPTPGSTTALSVLTAGLIAAPVSASSATTATSAVTASSSTTTTATPAATASTATTTSSAASTTSTTTSATSSTPSVASIFGVLPVGMPLANPCLATGEVDGACANATSAVGISSLAVSPDGRFLYATAASSEAVDVFARDASGNLTQTACLMNAPPPGPCTASSFVTAPTAIAVSPDGKNAYVVDAGNLVVANRNATTGALDPVSCIGGDDTDDNGSSDDSSGDDSGSDSRAHASDVATCASADGISSVSAVAVSPDGANVYITNSGGGLVTFARDPGTGALTETSCAADSDFLSEDTSSTCVMAAATNGVHLVVSPDGRNIYVLDSDDEALYGFGPAATPAAAGARVAADGRTALRIACPSASRSLCIGQVQLAAKAHAAPRSRSRHAARAARTSAPTRTTMISSAAPFRLAPGRSAVVHVRVPRAVRGSLHGGRRSLRVVADVRPVPGGGGASARTIVLR